MGQSSSRPRSTQPSTPQSERRQISTPTTQTDASGRPIRSDGLVSRHLSGTRSSTSTPAARDAAKRSRTQSMRDQLRALRPSSRPNSVASSSQVQEENSSFFKKRWRSSRRFSKTSGARNEPTPDEPGLEEPDDDEEFVDRLRGAGAGPSSSMRLHDSRPSTPFPVSGPPSPHPENNTEPTPEILSDEEQQASQNIGTWLGGSAGPTSAGDATDINREVLDFLGDGRRAVTPNQDPREPEAHIEPSHPPGNAPAPTRAAHFQAPSTLVVVQGVVNAQDPQPPHLPVPSSGSRSSLSRRSSSTPGIGNRSNATTEDRVRSRNRLSSFIRPASMLGRSGSDETVLDSPSSDQQPSGSIRAANAPTTDPDVGTQDSDGRAAVPTEPRSSRGLSAGSIDVLGTLLSVAATATAASLFAPPTSALLSSNNTQLPTSPPASSRPLSPTPTSGLGAFNSLGGLGLNPSAPNIATTADSRDRMRHAWDSLREMVGFNSRSNSEGALPSTDSSATPSEQRMRTGDAMLADMARLLNAGLGLPSQSSSDSASTANITIPSPSSPQTSEQSQAAPAEGSFERFLLDLQADLRNILTEDVESGEPSGSESTDNVDSSDPSTTDSSGSPSHSRSGTDDTNTSQDEPTSGPANHRFSFIPPVDEAIEPDAAEPHGQEQVEGNTVEAEEDVAIRPRVPTPIPSMWSSTPAYSETRERVARAQRTGFADVPSRSRSRQPSSQTDSGPSRDERDRPVVNLWRLYRFAPIPATQAQENVTRTARSPMATPSPAATPQPTTANSSPLASTEARPRAATNENSGTPVLSTPSTDAESPAPESASEGPAFVVPVIVVGLQSVETRSQDDDDDGMRWVAPLRANTPIDGDRTSDVPLQSYPSSPIPPSSNVTGRSWGSRAANALRGLRPGARRARANRLSDGTGSRTFLIYVIGGYYPPGHHMVTGSDQLDSYDALWELAELLGQAKPPTTTQEDIEKSGLEVIKASQLPQYETTGKISSNCTDRCLVCLEDYEDEDDVRILTCRHGFHKQCVDKWMQVGRNNCPACRTKGVVDDLPSSSSHNVSSTFPPSSA
ncbi:hypothetical protein BDY19DRAFT_948303 [Irpex rosettiformis]|uniref:Uncharacterized protein n=1 Tax=Irpex rosettiformis TaxID=378272 RepID=A0ACB8U2Y3_9APHY|nr:hypothetical protein BDY19DRAFT_948303 [Irpex rosettiformis]